MLNTKSFSVIDKDKVLGNIHVVGCGATGSFVIESLARLNLASRIIGYDMDVVEEKNLNNQAYLRKHIGMKKVKAIKNLVAQIDEDHPLRVKDKEVEYIRTTSKDVVVLAVDNFPTRVSILKNLEGAPLVISGGINSRGGNVEVTRGDYSTLIKEYENIKPSTEVDPDEVSACGSPISIYHRIRVAASLMVEEILKHHDNYEPVSKNIPFDVPSLMFING